ncbi:hypothetical protein B0H17DRAFT_1140138 [Mycena rosella]|uniref:Uncharacterized protein n=1 Tax=Mycena rosella TaxID=1033263 RepID=A0AAD7D3Z3_MYCRO|nr:hypothetical protein B0H17DRAFT_1140138 [Mycena rosella]
MREQPLRPALKTIPLHPGTYFRRSPAKSFELTDLEGHRNSRDKYQVLFEAAATLVGKTVGTLLGRLSSRFDAPALRAPALSRSCRGFGFDPPRGGPLGPSPDDYKVVSMLQRFGRPRGRDLAGGFGFDPPHGGPLGTSSDEYRVVSMLQRFERRRRRDLAGGLDLILPIEDRWDPPRTTIQSFRRSSASSVGAVAILQGFIFDPPYPGPLGPSPDDYQVVSMLQRFERPRCRDLAGGLDLILPTEDCWNPAQATIKSYRRCTASSVGAVTRFLHVTPPSKVGYISTNTQLIRLNRHTYKTARSLRGRRSSFFDAPMRNAPVLSRPRGGFRYLTPIKDLQDPRHTTINSSRRSSASSVGVVAILHPGPLGCSPLDYGVASTLQNIKPRRRCDHTVAGWQDIIHATIEALTIVQFFKRTSQEIKALGPLDCARKPVISW